MAGDDVSRITVLGRPLAMTIVLGLLMLATLNAFVVALFRRQFFFDRFPGAHRLSIFLAYISCGVLIIIGLAGVWLWKQWGVVLLCIVAGVVFVLDLLAHAPLFHIITGPAALAIILLVIQPVRIRFRSPG